MLRLQLYNCGRTAFDQRRRAPIALGAFILLTWVTVGSGAAPPAPEASLTVGEVTVNVRPGSQGLRLTCAGIDIIKHSELIATTPPWAPHYYVGPDDAAIRGAVREDRPDGPCLTLTHRGTNDSFVATETVAIRDGGRLVEQVLEARFLQGDGPAMLQWRAGALNSTIIIGRPFRGTSRDGGKFEGTVPVVPRGAGPEKAGLARGPSRIEFDSRLGPLSIEVESSRNMVIYDYRKDRWSNPDDPYFWFGDLDAPLKPGESVRYRIVYHLPARAEQAVTKSKPVEPVAVALTTNEQAQTAQGNEPPVLIPRPKEVSLEGPPALLTDPAALRIEFGDLPPGAAGEADSKQPPPAAQAVRGWWTRMFEQAPGGSKPPPAPDRSTEPLTLRLETATPTDKLPAEGYMLRVEPETITMRAGDARGFLYAAQTLRQLSALRADGAVEIRGAVIRDWPSLPFRGVHLFTGGQGPDLHLQLIRDVIAALKMNTIVLQSEYIRWDSHPEIHHPEYGMSKDDVRRILAVCREWSVEVIPLVMSLGHAQWMFETGHNLDLAEDPETPWAYCVTNPKTYDFIYEIYAEALELFKPRWFHVGHDEFHHRGRMPFRESSKPYTVAQLFLMDTLKHHAWFKERGVQMMMWGDIILGEGDGPDACHATSPEAARELRDKLPKDIIIADWHYADVDPDKYVNLGVLQGAGFKTVAATWYRFGNITNFTRAAHDQKSMGLLQTTWAGYSLDPGRFQAELRQYAAYVLAAEAAWNAAQPPDGDTYPAGEYFLDLMGLSTLRRENHSGWTADLSKAYNYPLAAAGAEDWFGLGPDYDLRQIPAGTARLKGIAWQLGRSGEAGAKSALLLRNRMTPDADLPREVELIVDRKARSLAILHTANFGCPRDALLGQYRVSYADGSTSTVDLRYGQNILAYNDPSAAAAAPIVWTGRNSAGEAIVLRTLIWTNPHPEKSIRALTAVSADGPAGLLLLGLTGLD